MRYLVLITGLFFTLQASAQEETIVNDSLLSYNRWTVEAMVGFSDGNYPYSTGFSASDKTQILSQFKLNNFDLGVRYMFTPKFGIKGNFTYSKYSESDNSSIPYQTNQFNLAIQGVVNAARVLDFGSKTRIGLLVHGGIHAASLTSKTDTKLDPILGEIPNDYVNSTEYHGGFVAGITPQYRITPKLAVFVDLSMYYNYRQHMNWDGTWNESSDLFGKNTNLSFGVSYSLGSDAIHSDWKEVKNLNEVKIAQLTNKLDEIEVMMQDTDRDGVVDYLDVEPNTIGGVAVDTKGRAIDLNKNGIPDELEGKDGKRGFNNYDKDGVTTGGSLIEQGIVNVFFDTNKDTPIAASSNNLYYVINFLKNNPETSVRVKGYADTTGNEKSNRDLAQRRAQNVTNFLIKSGVKSNQIEILGEGVDKSMDDTSKTGLQLARRVSFELINK